MDEGIGGTSVGDGFVKVVRVRPLGGLKSIGQEDGELMEYYLLCRALRRGDLYTGFVTKLWFIDNVYLAAGIATTTRRQDSWLCI